MCSPARSDIERFVTPSGPARRRPSCATLRRPDAPPHVSSQRASLFIQQPQSRFFRGSHRQVSNPRDAGHIVNDRADFANGQAFNVQSSEHIVSIRSQTLKENEMSGIKNKVVAITGASSGIGEATALLLAERGATV